MTDLLASAYGVMTPPTPSPGFMRSRVPLTLSGDYGVVLPALNPKDDNSVVNIIYQASQLATPGGLR